MNHAKAGMNARTLLVVDDEPELLDIVSNDVSNLGYSTDVAKDGETALAMIRQGGFDAVLCDLAMPKLDGMSLLKKVRAEGIDVPFVFLSAHPGSEHFRDAMRLGAFDFLRKPYAQDELHNSIHRMLEVGAKHREAADAMDMLRNESPMAKDMVEKVEKVHRFVNQLRAGSVGKKN